MNGASMIGMPVSARKTNSPECGTAGTMSVSHSPVDSAARTMRNHPAVPAYAGGWQAVEGLVAFDPVLV
jgi:hypothetical protein